MLTRRVFLGAVSAAALFAATGISFAQSMDVALISKGFQHQFWQAVKAGADKAAAELGVNATFEGPDSESQVDRQMDMLAAALSRKPAAIGFAALDSQAATPLLEQAKQANIPVIAFDSGVDSDIPLTTATTDNVAAAALAAGADGLIVEVHPDPEGALSDGDQSLTLPQFQSLMAGVTTVHAEVRDMHGDPVVTAAAAK